MPTHMKSHIAVLRRAFFTIVCLAAITGQIRAQTANTAKIYAGIEIGAKGVKATVLSVTSDAEGYDADIKFNQTANTGIMTGVLKTGGFTSEAMDETANAVKRFYTQIKDQFRIPDDQLFIAGSSALATVKNRADLQAKVRAFTGKDMEFITVADEVTLAIEGVVPTRFLKTSMLIDIGSGNTKGGYRESSPPSENNGSRFVTMGIEYGTVTFTDKVNKECSSESDFTAKAAQLRTTLLAPALEQQAERKAGLLNRPQIYLSGGIVWAMATLLHPWQRKAFVRLTTADIQQFYKLATTDPQRLLNPDLSSAPQWKFPQIRDPRRRNAAAATIREDILKEVQRVKDTFTPKNLIAGAEILQAISTQFNLPARQLRFARYGYLAWIFSYVSKGAIKEMERSPRRR